MIVMMASMMKIDIGGSTSSSENFDNNFFVFESVVVIGQSRQIFFNFFWILGSEILLVSIHKSIEFNLLNNKALACCFTGVLHK